MSQSKYGFTGYEILEFEAWIKNVSVSRTVSFIQQHHTWSPRYSDFNGANHFEMQRGMKNYHVSHNGWSDIGQNFTIFPDGLVMTGRPLNSAPACIYGNNARAICIENIGDFDAGRDTMNAAQRDAIVRATAALARRFSLVPVTTANIVYHHWFDLNTGVRTNGAGTTKSCPGTTFFGGNSVAACAANFLPLVEAALGGVAPPVAPVGMSYRRITIDELNIRTGPGSGNALADAEGPLRVDSVVRVFAEANGWLKISNSKEYWIYGKWSRPVERKTVHANDSKVRQGPGTSFTVVDAYDAGVEVFVDAVSGGWSRISILDRWMSSSLLS